MTTSQIATQEGADARAATVRPKIFVFVNNVMGRDLIGAAIAEDGTGLGGHLSSHEGFLRHDMGLTSDWHHDDYRAHYPDGYEMVDVIDVEGWQTVEQRHAGLAAALERAKERAALSAGDGAA